MSLHVCIYYWLKNQSAYWHMTCQMPPRDLAGPSQGKDLYSRANKLQLKITATNQATQKHNVADYSRVHKCSIPMWLSRRAGAKGTISKVLVRLLSVGSFKSVNGKDGEGGGEKEDITIPWASEFREDLETARKINKQKRIFLLSNIFWAFETES